MRSVRLPIAAALIAAFNLASLEVSASTLTVSNCNDSGNGSLRSAMISAVNNDVIDLTQLACSTITLSAASGSLQTAASAGNVTLNGPTGHTLTIDGGTHDRVIRHLGNGTIALNDLTIVNGKYNPPSGASDGGCINANAGAISLTRTHVSSCAASGYGACINALSSITLTNSTFSGCEGAVEAVKGDTVRLQDSSITNSSGGINAYNAYLRGSTISGVANDGVMAPASIQIYDSTIANNGLAGIAASETQYCYYDEYHCYYYPSPVTIHSSIIAGNGTGGIVSLLSDVNVYASIIEHNQGRGGIFNANKVVMTDSTISGNAAAPNLGSSGGISASQLTATRSTISGNSGVDAGGAAVDFATLVNTTVSSNRAASGTKPVGGIKTIMMTVYNSTIAFNTGEAVGGIYAVSGKVESSIIAGNNDSSASYDRNLFVKNRATFSNNIIISSNVPTGAITADPQLTPLANHGGLVPAHALLATSPALDAGNNPTGVSTDARGPGFARVVGANPDIGAYERQADEDEIFGNGIDGA